MLLIILKYKNSNKVKYMKMNIFIVNDFIQKGDQEEFQAQVNALSKFT